jgi:hypothetical protein
MKRIWRVRLTVDVGGKSKHRYWRSDPPAWTNGDETRYANPKYAAAVAQELRGKFWNASNTFGFLNVLMYVMETIEVDEIEVEEGESE